MNLMPVKLKLAQIKEQLALKKSLLKSFLADVPNAPKIVMGIGLGLAAVLLIYFYIAPFFTGIISDYFHNYVFDKTIKSEDKDRIKHETNANILANERITIENSWNDFQANRANAQAVVNDDQKQLDDQEGEYKNAKAGNTNIDTNLSLSERRARVLAEDRRRYPNANAASNTGRTNKR